MFSSLMLTAANAAEITARQSCSSYCFDLFHVMCKQGAKHLAKMEALQDCLNNGFEKVKVLDSKATYYIERRSTVGPDWWAEATIVYDCR